MVIFDRPTNAVGLEVRRKIGRPFHFGTRLYGGWYYGEVEPEYSPVQYGRVIYGDFKYGSTKPLWGIYQMRMGKHGKIIVQEKFYRPISQTQPNKVARQLIMRAAVLAWHGLTAPQKAVYNERAKYKRFSGYNIFVKEYLLSH